MARGVDALAIGRARAVRDPDAAALAHERIERHGDAAGRRRDRDAAILASGCAGTAHGWRRRRAGAARWRRSRPPAPGRCGTRPARRARRGRSPPRAASAPGSPQVGNSVASTEARPSVMPACEMRPVHRYSAGRLANTRRPQPGRDTEADEPDAHEHQERRHDPERHEGVEPKRRADRHEEDDEHREAPPAAARSSSASPCATATFSITMPAASAASSGSTRSVRPTWLEHHAHADQHDRDLARDVAQVQREERADQAAEGDGAADLPGESDEDVDLAARPGRRRTARPAPRPRTAPAR